MRPFNTVSRFLSRETGQKQRWSRQRTVPTEVLKALEFPPGSCQRGVLWHHLVARGHHNSRLGDEMPEKA